MPGLSGLQILVIDDNAQMRTIIGAVLLAAGVRRICYAPNGKAGLEMLVRREIDVVFCDYEMPVMNGLAFIRAARKLGDAHRFVPIIMLTGHSDFHHILRARDAGMTEFLGKPVTARSILARLSAVILKPRPFVASADYFGPDRRRRRTEHYGGPFRRFSDMAHVAETVEI